MEIAPRARATNQAHHQLCNGAEEEGRASSPGTPRSSTSTIQHGSGQHRSMLIVQRFPCSQQNQQKDVPCLPA